MKIADFGLSKDLNDPSVSPQSSFGVPVHTDPRFLKGLNDRNYIRDKKSDIYSLGVLFWVISSGTTPFESYSNNIDLIISVALQKKRESPIEGTPSAYVDLYQRCWNDDPNIRPDIQEVLEKLEQIFLQDQDNVN